MSNDRGLTPAAEAYLALKLLTMPEGNPAVVLAEYDPMVLRQGRAAVERLFDALTPTEQASVLPSYTEVMFSANGSPECRGMVRDLIGLPRRITNLDSGTEFFVDAAVEDFTLRVMVEAD